MQNKTYTLKLDTSYDTTGNSTGCGLDTLGIAFGFGDSNEMTENNYEVIFDNVDYAKKQWLDNEAEGYFRKTIPSKAIHGYIKDIASYHKALSDYRDTFDSVNLCEYDSDDEAQVALYKVLEKAEGDIQDELYSLWLNGDYREEGLLTKANRHFSEWGITLDDAKQGEVSATLSNDTLELLKDSQTLDEDATPEDVIQWLENEISYMARNVYRKEKERREKSKAERERVAKYQAEQKEKAQERKKAELLALKAELLALKK